MVYLKKVNADNDLLRLALVIFIFFCCSCQKKSEPVPENFFYKNFVYDKREGVFNITNSGLLPTVKVSFSVPINKNNLTDYVILSTAGQRISLNITTENLDSAMIIRPTQPLKSLSQYKLEILPSLLSKQNQQLNTTLEANIITQIDSTNKFPIISDDALLDLVQRQTFKYFWDFAHPVSGMARERDTSGDLVTSGGTGFGIMCLPIAIKRGFISHEQGLQHCLKIVDFLSEKAVKYHGVFPHWLHGGTGATIPFSAKDNGGDLVETSYLVAGLLTARQFFNQSNSVETILRKKITKLWEEVEWNWHTKNDGNVLYWHWSPNFGWDMNLPIRGWNESLITYVLAAASPTYPIKKEVYTQGWARNGAIKNGNNYYGINLPLGQAHGGPLFFAHYSFLGLNPNLLKDQYADYFIQTKNHTLVNRAYCIANPRQYMGYSAQCWGLTASDTYSGYSAHAPDNDLGVISPTAALSSMPYTPEYSMQALRFFYYTLGDKLWKQYGFVDAFSLNRLWFASSFLAIDQGPIICMIENHRSGLLWQLFMADDDVKKGLKKLEFTVN